MTDNLADELVAHDGVPPGIPDEPGRRSPGDPCSARPMHRSRRSTAPTAAGPALVPDRPCRGPPARPSCRTTARISVFPSGTRNPIDAVDIISTSARRSMVQTAATRPPGCSRRRRAPGPFPMFAMISRATSSGSMCEAGVVLETHPLKGRGIRHPERRAAHVHTVRAKLGPQPLGEVVLEGLDGRVHREGRRTGEAGQRCDQDDATAATLDHRRYRNGAPTRSARCSPA